MRRIIAAGKAARHFQRQNQAPPTRVRSNALVSAAHIDLDRSPSPIERAPVDGRCQVYLAKQQEERSTRFAGGEADGPGESDEQRLSTDAAGAGQEEKSEKGVSCEQTGRFAPANNQKPEPGGLPPREAADKSGHRERAVRAPGEVTTRVAEATSYLEGTRKEAVAQPEVVLPLDCHEPEQQSGFKRLGHTLMNAHTQRHTYTYTRYSDRFSCPFRPLQHAAPCCVAFRFVLISRL